MNFPHFFSCSFLLRQLSRHQRATEIFFSSSSKLLDDEEKKSSCCFCTAVNAGMSFSIVRMLFVCTFLFQLPRLFYCCAWLYSVFFYSFGLAKNLLLFLDLFYKFIDAVFETFYVFIIKWRIFHFFRRRGVYVEIFGIFYKIFL